MNTNRAFLICEAGVNHNGSVELANQLVEVAATAGGDAIKFQTFRAEKLVTRGTRKAAYQSRTTGAEEGQFEMLKRLELPENVLGDLAALCRSRKIEFMSTPFDVESVDLLRDIGIDRFKIASGDITDFSLLVRVARTGKPIILSTGMSDLAEIEAALGALAFGLLGERGPPSHERMTHAFSSLDGQSSLKSKVTLLHCTSAYPAPDDQLNLRAMKTLESAFQLKVGLSDHSVGTPVPIAAVAMGAQVIEKHFTVSRSLPGPDHAASLEPSELMSMISSIRRVEAAFGDSRKVPTLAELENRGIARKSLVANGKIAKGEIFTETNLTTKRPNSGISASEYWHWIGKPANRSYEPDEIIEG